MKQKLSYLKANFFVALNILLFLLLIGSAAFAQYPAGSPVAMNGKLKVVGTHLTSECGNAVQLRGMSSHGLQWFGNCNTGSALDALTNTWKVDIFRLAMYVQEGGYVNNPSGWKTTIDNYVDACGSRGIYCLIDWHVLTPGDPNANISDARDFWTYMATKHGSKKHVLYEICNEPNGVSWSTVKNYANDIIPRIRAIDPNTVIIVGTPNWSQDVDVASTDKLNYSNIMYTLHFYSGTHAQSFRDKGNTAMNNGAAIFCTEWGTSQASGNGGTYLTEADNWINWMASNKISWCNWSFSDNTESSAALNSGSCLGGNWNNTSTSGTYVKGKLTGTADNFTDCGGGTTNQLPTISITAPANNATYTAPASITINATASDPDGTISKVDFYNGTTLLVSDASSPYSYTWTNVAAGTYTITAKATDNSGGVTTSSAITVVVSVPTNQLPSVSITAPANNATYTAPASSIVINATATDADGSISKVDFYNGTTLLGSDASSPYSYTWSNVAAGTYTITAKATDNAGGVTTSTAITIIVSIPQGPYTSGSPIPIPGTVEAEKYDVGGQGVAYNDADAGNSGSQFRTDDVDIEACTDAGGGYNIGWTAAGEWLEYTVNVTASGSYNFNARVASMASGKTLHVEMNGVNVTGTMSVPNTGGYQTWQTVTVSNINLTIGNNQIMRVYFETDAINLNYVSVTSANQAPVVSISSPSNNASFCSGTTIPMTATATDGDGTISKVDFYDGITLLGTVTAAPYTYNWANAATGTHSITAKATDNASAVTTSTAVSITINANPSAPAVTSAVTYCQNATASALTATGSTLKWYTVSTGGTASSTAPTPTTSAAGTTNYYVSQTTNSCESPRATITVTVNATPSAPGVTASVTYCQNATASALTASGTSLKWYTASTGGTASSTAPTPVTSSAGTTNYYVSQTTSGCESPRAMIAVTVNATPSAPTVTSSVTYCQNATASALTATGSTLNWYTVSTGGTASSTAPTPATSAAGTTNYYVSQTTNGCESPRAMITVTVNATPSAPTVTSAASYCQNATASALTASGTALKWYTVSTGGTSSGTAPVPNTGTIGTTSYYVSQTTNGCESPRATITVTINAAATATITAGGSTTFCQGGSVTLTANTGSSYIWFNGANQVGTNATYTATASGNYTVQVTNPSGCQGQVTSAVTTVTVNSLPVATITPGGPTTFCEGLKVDLAASAGSSYVWFNGTTQVGTGSSYSASVSGNYTVQITNVSNCKATSAVTAVTVNSLPAAAITAGSSTTFCQGGNVTLTSSAGSSYIWYNGTSQVGTNSTYIASSSGDYSVKVTNASNCQATSPATSVTVNTGTASITADGPTTICQGDHVILTANAGISYIWYNGTTQVGTNASYTASSAGSYTVKVTANCEATSSATVVSVNPLPTATITAGGPTTFTQGGSVLLSANTGAGLSYKWFNGAVQLGINSTYTATTGGNYTVEVTNASGCKLTSSPITVTVNGNILPSVNITSPSNNTTLVGPANVSLSATASDPDGSITKVDFYYGTTFIGTVTTAPYNFAWNNLTTGTYNVTAVATDNLGATSSSAVITIQVNANQASNVTITSPSNNSSITGTSVTINVSATDPDGNIVLVEYYDGTTLIGSSSSQPYSFVWDNPTQGTHVITVKVTDSNGGVTTSSPTTLNIGAPSGIISASGYSIFTNVYPNPSNEIFTLKSSEEIKDLWIVNVLGEEISNLKNIKAGQQVEIGKELPDGTFVLMIKYASDKMEVAKIVKIK